MLHHICGNHEHCGAICVNHAHGGCRVNDSSHLNSYQANNNGIVQISGLYSGYTTALAWISNTLPRPPDKRAAALAFINAVSNATSIYSSYLYPDSAYPRFRAAFIHNCLLAAVAVGAALTMRIMLARLNKKLDRGEKVEGAINAAPGEATEHGFRFRL